MASPLCFTSPCSLKTPYQLVPGLFIRNSTPGIGNFVRDNELIQSSTTLRFQSLQVKATTGGSKDTKVNSILCPDCDGNGAVSCSQCKGTGVNSVDHFNGQFKAGGLCWLCRGKRDILCGNCNGAGFVGGFMSTSDE